MIRQLRCGARAVGRSLTSYKLIGAKGGKTLGKEQELIRGSNKKGHHTGKKEKKQNRQAWRNFEILKGIATQL